MANEDVRISDAGLAILAELLQVEITVHGISVALEMVQGHPAAALLRNEIGVVRGIANQAGESVAKLRDLVWSEFGIVEAAPDHA